jgi:site-specific DNA-methyltransferase (adenine-specific)
MKPMWEAFKRIIKPRGAIVLTASGKFTYQLVMSNFEMFKYEWIWNKNNSAGFALAPRRPFLIAEHICIFGNSKVNYYPQLEVRGIPRRKGGYSKSDNYGVEPTKTKTKTKIYYPKNILVFSNASQLGKTHPTQKPVALFEYLIRTYTQPGDVVFDPCVGSGTTAIAARQCNRNFICGDSSEEYVKVSRERLALPYTPNMFEEVRTEAEQAQQIDMFDDITS